MARRSRTTRPDRSSREAPTLPVGPVPIDTGTAHLEQDPDHAARVTLHVNGVPSSCLDLADPGFLAFEYLQQMAAVVDLLPPGPVRALHLGAAGCALPRQIEHVRPDSRQLGVDIDARLLTLVREWFSLPRSPRLRLRADDAGHALASLPAASFDVVVRDAFDGDTTPGHLVGRAFAGAALRVLRPGGLLLVNCADRPPLERTRQELASIVPSLDEDAVADGRLAVVAEPAVLKGRRYGNVVIAAVAPGSADPAAGPDLGDAGLARALRSLAVPARVLVGDELARLVGSAAPLP
ncbi:methyltransferase family protein [Isoptericola sp. CG 20/1183]|uniref:Methyltransferase family protein n=1 Tax=Isoptericola halotolerans TaxID=300560 RepID=A0ABX5ECM8_9MICO|nr:methyltransferase family protein [Isoptericola halotolerans]PRZ06159.1 methyltransferase family protein [Isoptericola sp. CG 20/1183]